MQIDLPLLATRVFNTPHLVNGDKLDTMLAAVGARILSGGMIHHQEGAPSSPTPRALRSDSRYMPMGAYMADIEAGVAVLPILGTLVRRGSFLDSVSGMSSYGALTDAITAIITSTDVRGLILECDTPGGEAGGCFDFANFIRVISAATGKPVWAHANEQAESAGYAIASATEEIWIARTGVVGSIGVVAAHVDMSKADEKAGLKWTYIYAGETKTDGNSHEPLSTRARDDVQADVDSLNLMFVELVAEYRGVSSQKIIATNAKSFRGSLAIEAGLADYLGTLDEAVSAMSTRISEGSARPKAGASASKARRDAMSGENNENVTETPATPAPAVPAPAAPAPAAPAPAAPAPAAPAPAAPASAEGSSAETARCADLSEIASQASALGVPFDLSAAIRGNVSASAARQTILAAAAGRDEASAVTPGSVSRADGLGANKGKSGMTPEAAKNAWGKAHKRR